MWVKICANTNLEDALLAAELGADAVGFVFAPSRRQVTAAQVAAITRELPASIEKVGVFTTTDAAEILATAVAAGVTMVQLHREFDPQLVEAVRHGSNGKLPVLQVLAIGEATAAADLRSQLVEIWAHPFVAAVLLDVSHEGVSGGTGRTFDWERTAEVVKQARVEGGGRLILAGGLRAENVREAILRFTPWGVDVASGVEQIPGRKDPQRLKAYIDAAKAGELSPSGLRRPHV